jgi:hypothetical protein
MTTDFGVLARFSDQNELSFPPYDYSSTDPIYYPTRNHEVRTKV